MSYKRCLLLILVPAALAFSGCGKSALDESKAENNSNLPASFGNGSISGKVVLKGTLPPPAKLSVSADPYCSNVNAGSVKDETVVVAANGAMANVFVYVKEGAGSYPPPDKPVLLEQKSCVYAPHVTGVQINQPLRIRNNDPTLHNLHMISKANGTMNIGLLGGADPFEIKFAKPEVMVEFKCDCHDWMYSYVGVLPHPFFCVTGNDGTYQIKRLPPGNYKLVAWQEKYGESIPQNVEIKNNEAVTQDFTFTAR